MKKFFELLSKYFGVMAVVFLLLGLFTSDKWLWVMGNVKGVFVMSLMLGLIMFGMGTTSDYKDFWEFSKGRKMYSWERWHSIR